MSKSCSNPAPKHRLLRTAGALPAALLALAVIISPRDVRGVEARPNEDRVGIFVVDQHGDALRPATVMACPFEAGTANCAHLLAADTNSAGRANLVLEAGLRYQFTAFVRDPNPPYACPGYPLNGSVFYFSGLIEAVGDELAPHTELVVYQPTVFDCIPVTVTDDVGNPLPGAGLMICRVSDDPSCANPSFDAPDLDGVIRLTVDPSASYEISAFLANSGWPCPQYVSPDGTTFHFSPNLETVGADLEGGTTLVIHEPAASECT